MPNDYTGLLSGSYWGGIEVTGKPTIVTYSFPATAPGYIATLGDANLTPAALASYTGFDPAEQALARTALAEWGNASGLIFIEVAPGNGDINFQKLDFTGTVYAGAGGIAYRPFGAWDFFSYPNFTSDLDGAGDVFMNSTIAVTYGTLLHEIGHALGLKHPTEAWTQYAALPPVVHQVWTVDDPTLTIMSELAGGTGHLTAIDIQAIQSIYGTQAQDGTQVAFWAWNAGTQTLTQTGFATNDVIRGSSVRDVMNGGTGDDALFGLADADTLNGGAGNDSLNGGAGSDRMAGGAGDDLYFFTTGDTMTEAVNSGIDTVYASVTVTLAANQENLSLFGAAKVTGTGNGLANQIFANGAGNTLRGLAGNDYIVGSTGLDTLTGGAGSDSVFGQAGADRFVFAAYADFGPANALDSIGDFSQADGDKISLQPIDPNSAVAGNQAFTFIGAAAFSATAAYQVRVQTSGPDMLVQIDANRDQVADYQILLYGVTALVAGDFLL